MVSELTIFSGCLFGGVATLAWWASALLLRDRGDKLRERLRGSEWDPRTKFGKEIRAHSAHGIKPMSEFGSRRLVKMAAR